MLLHISILSFSETTSHSDGDTTPSASLAPFTLYFWSHFMGIPSFLARFINVPNFFRAHVISFTVGHSAYPKISMSLIVAKHLTYDLNDTNSSLKYVNCFYAVISQQYDMITEKHIHVPPHFVLKSIPTSSHRCISINISSIAFWIIYIFILHIASLPRRFQLLSASTLSVKVV